MHSARVVVQMLASAAVLGAACSAAVRSHSFTFPNEADPPLRAPVQIPGFDPALGTLKCIDIVASVVWDSTGQVSTLNLNAQAFLATVSVGEITDIGYEEADTFITVAGVTDGVQFDVQHPEGMISTKTPYTRSGSGSNTTHVLPGDPGFDRFIAAGDVDFMLERIPDEAVLAPLPPDPFVGIVEVVVQESHAAVTYTITYHYVEAVPCGDANDDGLCDFLDLNIVLSDYGGGDACSSGDLNGDGTCDFLDLNQVLSFFGSPCK